jgi:ribosomal protein L11 methyltransferase
VSVRPTSVAHDWADRWRTFHKPLMIGDPEAGPAVWIRPPWEPERADLAEVVVDPGQAFGTGAHPTTRLCVEALIRVARDGGPFGGLTDLGCGSGVLAIAAGKLGWKPLEGCDHEVAAVDASRENARVNGVNVVFERIDLKAGLPKLNPTTVANLTAPLLEAVAAGLAPDNLPQTLICSGLLATEYDRVLAAFTPFGLVETARGTMGDWGSLVFTLEPVS